MTVSPWILNHSQLLNHNLKVHYVNMGKTMLKQTEYRDCVCFHDWMNCMNKLLLKDNTILSCFSLFICCGPCHQKYISSGIYDLTDTSQLNTQGCFFFFFIEIYLLFPEEFRRMLKNIKVSESKKKKVSVSSLYPDPNQMVNGPTPILPQGFVEICSVVSV